MKIQHLLFKAERQVPADCVIESHSLMIRGRYIRPVGSGIFSLYPITIRIANKIEKILREEMDNIGGQEVLFPVVIPSSLWQESGRFESIGPELLRLKDRNGVDMVLGMTHEEAAVQLVRDVAQSYSKFPFMIYQIQTKFRDEPRSRGGLIRTREFTMKDAYSFHTSQDDLERYYNICYNAYERIFKRCGIPQVVAVKSDSGMMGGRISHEFMLLTDVGEDTLVICSDCNYRSNMEVAECVIKSQQDEEEEESLVEVSTPGCNTVDKVCSFLNKYPHNFCKAVLYQKNVDDSLVLVFLRGDLEVNETKLRNYIGSEIHPAVINNDIELCIGYIGPIGLPDGIPIVYDESLKYMKNFVTGANKVGFHYSGVNTLRDIGSVEFINVSKAFEGGVCPVCGRSSLSICRGIEVGNIFQLGAKYTKTMNMQYLDSDGILKHPIMGCYGIGVGRLIASVCQVNRDNYGPIWPMTISPWQVHMCALRIDNEEVRKVADNLYNLLLDSGIEVLYDDRNTSAGNMFSDADLIGIPLRVVVSPRSLSKDCIEVSARDKTFSFEVSISNATSFIKEKISTMIKMIES